MTKRVSSYGLAVLVEPGHRCARSGSQPTTTRIWHESGTTADAGLVSADRRPANMAADLGFPASAPGRTRTCDPLLGRPERYSEML